MSTNSLINLSVQQLKRAITIREKIEDLEKELATLLGAEAPVVAVAGRKKGRGKKRVMSSEARARIAAAQRERWAKKKGAAKTVKRKISSAGRARIAEAARQRWAKFRASKAKAAKA